MTTDAAQLALLPSAPRVPHPAKFTPALLPHIAELLGPHPLRILDPFAGVGGIHALRHWGHDTTGVELEPEWARQHPGTIVGDARRLPFPDDTFDAVTTSPAYGNRMADHHDARDTSRRITYRHTLGRALTDGNAGGLQWGAKYRTLHQDAWAEAVRVLRPAGVFILNCRDHYRAGVLVPVTQWHLDTLTGLGLTITARRYIDTPGMRYGQNGGRRTAGEHLVRLDRTEEDHP